ncbi:MAG: hypothetical protein JSS91_08890 [Bacteroidetes bacterium]|nr:hypothetical protein [Bacteroidota bacterium]
MQTYIKTDQQIHQLSQTIAKFNRSYAIKKEDDSHTSLALDQIGNRLLGRWVDSSEGNVILALTFDKLRFEIFNDSMKSLFSVDIGGKTQFQAEEDIISFLPQIGLSAESFSKPLHFEIPDYDFIHDTYFRFKENELNELNQWIHSRALANDACGWLNIHLRTDCEVRIWPHHFDTGIYVEPNKNTGIGFGLAMQDGIVNNPYYYFSGYGLNGHNMNFDLTGKLKYGSWIITENWKGAVLKLSEANRETVKEFLLEVTQWYLDH